MEFRCVARSLTASVLFFAGCAEAPPAPPVEPRVTVAAPVAPAPSTAAQTEDPAPVAASAQPVGASLAILPGKSIGGVALGQSPLEVLRVLGRPDEVAEYDDGKTVYFSYRPRGLSFRFEDGRVAGAFAYSGRKGGYEKGDYVKFEGKTPEGIGLDATYAEVLQVYGQPTKSGELGLAPIPSRWIVYEDLGVGFDFVIATDQMIVLNISRPK